MANFRSLIVPSLLVSSALSAQPVLSDRQVVDLDSTEGWAMARTTAATLNLGPAPPASLEPWQLAFSAEIGSIPHVDRSDRLVGLGATKFEDLNKSPVFGRGRLHLGLPGGFTAELSYAPPVEIDGARPDGIYGLALERSLIHGDRWALGARLFGQAGHAQGDITCSREVASLPPGAEGNPFGCREPSRDDIELDHGGAELFLSASLRDERWHPFASLAVSRIDPEVQIDARVFSVIDRSQVVTEGNIETGTVGVTYRSSTRWQWTAAFSYTPLDVRRPPGFSRESDDFWSVRLGLIWRPGAR